MSILRGEEDSTARSARARAGLFDGFPEDVSWQWMAITPAELATVRYIDYDYWVELSGGTRLAVDAAPPIVPGWRRSACRATGRWAWRARLPAGPASRR